MKPAMRVRPFAIWRDAAIGAAGLVAMLTLLAGVRPAPVAAAALGVAAGLFAVLLARALIRHRRRAWLDGAMLSLADPMRRRTLDLDRLTSFRLDFYPGMYDRTRGLYVLRLADPRGQVTLDSELEGFPEIVARARTAARIAALPLAERTIVNLQALESHPDRSP